MSPFKYLTLILSTLLIFFVVSAESPSPALASSASCGANQYACPAESGCCSIDSICNYSDVCADAPEDLDTMDVEAGCSMHPAVSPSGRMPFILVAFLVFLIMIGCSGKPQPRHC